MVSLKNSFVVINFRSKSGASLNSVFLNFRQTLGWVALDFVTAVGVGFLLGRIF